MQRVLTGLRIFKPKRYSLTILNDISAVVKPGRYLMACSWNNKIYMHGYVVNLGIHATQLIIMTDICVVELIYNNILSQTIPI